MRRDSFDTFYFNKEYNRAWSTISFENTKIKSESLRGKHSDRTTYFPDSKLSSRRRKSKINEDALLN